MQQALGREEEEEEGELAWMGEDVAEFVREGLSDAGGARKQASGGGGGGGEGGKDEGVGLPRAKVGKRTRDGAKL